MSKEFHPRGHLRTGQLRCNKCGKEISKREGFYDCPYCGPVCTPRCAYGCFEKNEHCRSR